MTEYPAIGVIRQVVVSKKDIETFSCQLIEAVKEGHVNPLELKASFKAIEQIIEVVNEKTKAYQLTEAAKYSEKKFTAFGVEIEKAEVGTKYDYSVCGDPIYNHRLKIFEEAKIQLDERATFLKALKEPLTLVDDESGEVATVKPPLKKSQEGLKFYIK
jgi:hypothetical protein